MTARSVALSILLLAAQAAPARASEPPEFRVSACYDITFAGFGIAEMAVMIEGSREYQADLRIATYGLVDLFGAFRFEAASAGRMVGTENATPLRYVSVDGSEPEDRERIALDFDPATGAIAERIAPPRNRVKVAPGLRVGAVDPLTALIRLRGAIRERLERRGEAPIVLPLYDGSKRYDLELTIHGREAEPPGGVIRATARITPLAGFSARQRSRVADSFDVALSDDDYFLPVRIEARWSTITLVDRATDGRRCDG